MVGIAKDGYIIVSPWMFGKYIDCRRYDQCGGFELSDGTYAYVL